MAISVQLLPHPRFRDRRPRTGSVLILTSVMLIVLVGVMAFALDFASVHASKAEMRRSADSAAMAACWQLYQEKVNASPEPIALDQVFETANRYAFENPIGKQGPRLSRDTADVRVGYVNWLSRPEADLDLYDYNLFNAVEVTVRRTAQSNGELPLNFARIFGIYSQRMEVTARAGLATSINGFELDDPNDKLNLMPFAVDEETWNLALSNVGEDNYSHHADYGDDAQSITSGTDGQVELTLYPGVTGSQANRGTVDLGGGENSTDRVSRQILEGVSKQDLEAFGRPLKIGDDGRLMMGGDPGISAGFKEELASVIGKQRMIMVYSEMDGDGNNGAYTIVKFVGVRVMDVDLTSNKKRRHLTVQPSPMVVRHATFDTSGSNNSSDLIFTPVFLFR